MFKELIDGLSYGILVLDEELRIQYVNSYMENILKSGCSNKDYMGKVCGNAFSCITTMSDAIQCGEGEECKRCSLRKRLLAIKNGKFQGELSENIFKIMRKNGDSIRFKLKGYRFSKDDKNLIAIELQNAEKEEMLEKMGIWNRKLENILDNLNDQVCILDDNLNYIYANRTFCQAVNMEREEIIGKNDYDLVSPELAKICQENSRYALENDDFSREEFVTGDWYHVMKGKVEISEGKYGVFGVIKNINEEKKKDQGYRKKIYLDSLTGLYNRNFYQEEIKKIYREKMFSDEELTMLLVDIDNFKQINDLYGHHEGDRLIRDIAQIVRRFTRNSDYPVRMGGDEIAIFTHGSREDGEKLGKKILKEVQNLPTQYGTVSVSIGIASRLDYTDTLLSIYKRADKAMYESKKGGKGRVTVCSRNFQTFISSETADIIN